MKEPDSVREDALRRTSVALAGEGLEYFAQYKLRVLRRILGKSFTAPLLDFGCGAGDFTRLLAQTFDAVHGYDPSAQAIELAKKRVPRAELFDDTAALPKGHYGAVILAGVLRHIPPENRPGLMRNVVQLLARRGKAIVFEHNGLHPIMRKVVRDAEDPDTIIPSPWEVKRLLKDAGLAKRSFEYIVFFPRALSMLRPLEPLMWRLPAGAQVVAWGEKR
jgi:2-polyprenyl-3-methyl-5-hydroxy-6-metoxy-1,4-benzoquinol methylase